MGANAEGAVDLMPAYQYAADNHSIGGGGFALTEPSTWSSLPGKIGDVITLCAPAAVISGAYSFYNTGVAAANWFGANEKEVNIGAAIASLDSNMGAYYQENKEAVDLVGFIASSFIPGTLGIKALNAGQRALRAAETTGLLGANMSRATGLLIPAVDIHRSVAAAELAQTSATFSSMSASTLKAIGAGYAQAALESAAFETAVAATLYKSPVLENADGWDMAKNVMIGTGVGGIIGGAFAQAATSGIVKRGALSVNPAEKLITAGEDIAGAGLTSSQRMMAYQKHKEALPQVPTAGEFLSGKYATGVSIPEEFAGTQKLIAELPEKEQAAAAAGFETKFNRLRSDVEMKLDNNLRKATNAITEGTDNELGNAIADIVIKTNSIQGAQNFEFLDQLGRVGQKLKAEKQIARDDKNLLDLAAEGKTPISANYQVGFIKLYGEGAGNVTFGETPRVLSLADTAKNTEELLKTVKKYGFKDGKEWSALSPDVTHGEVEARYIAIEQGKLKLENGMTIGQHDIPMLEHARTLWQRGATGDTPPSINLSLGKGNGTWEITTAEELGTHLQLAKDEVIESLQGGVIPATARQADEVAKIANVKQSYVEGMRNNDPSLNLFARQDAREQYVQDLKKAGIWTQAKEDTFGLTPQTVKASYKIEDIKGLDGNVLRGLSYVTAKGKMHQDLVNNIVEDILPGVNAQLYHPSQEVLMGANRAGAGPGFLSSANGNPGSLASWSEWGGSVTQRATKTLQEQTQDKIASATLKLAQNQTAALEFEVVNKEISAARELYGIDTDGVARPLKVLDYNAAVAKGEAAKEPVLAEGTKLEIRFSSDEAAEMWKLRTELTGGRTEARTKLNNVQGHTDNKDPRAMRPLRQDPKDFPFFAIVVDESVTGVGHKSMLYAASAKDLEEMIEKVPKQFTVLRKDQTADFFKARGEYDFERTLHENYIDSSLKQAGVSNAFLPRTDPQKIVQSILADHAISDRMFVRDVITAKFQKEFNFLKEQGEQYSGIESSRYTGSARSIEAATNNPYAGYTKTALNVNRLSEHPIWSAANNFAENVVSRAVSGVEKLWNSSKSVQDLEGINAALEKAGVKSAYYDAATNALANSSLPKGELMKFVRNSNSILSSLTIRMDPLNAINNAVGANVLLGSELPALLRMAGQGNKELVGKLAELTSIELPGMATPIRTAGKMLRTAIANSFNPDAVGITGKTLHQMYTAAGFDARIMTQFNSILEDASLQGVTSVGGMNVSLRNMYAKAKELGDFGEKWSGNKLAEAKNRFFAADVARQMSDPLLAAGKMGDAEQLAFINTFVNRTQGNIIASQRPIIFQGPIGQAIGLFQSYQFNMLQQVFRHASEGRGKDVAMLMGLQGTIYGLNGLPAFNAINTHILGTASGNPQHTDAYSATYGILGKQAGDLLLYGLPSNMLQANLYTRGDINPRQVTVVPTNPADVPLVGAYIKTLSNIKDMAGKITGGADIWQTILQGVEHNGISRPLAGLAQTAQAITNGGEAYSTTTKGSVSYKNDLLSWATAARLVGGKPLDEGIVNDAAFRFTAYQAADHARLNTLGEALRTTVIAGNEPTAAEIETFTQKYTAAGGSIQNFNRYMLKQMKDANTSQANKIAAHLKNPGAKNFQEIMGGRDGYSE